MRTLTYALVITPVCWASIFMSGFGLRMVNRAVALNVWATNALKVMSSRA